MTPTRKKRLFAICGLIAGVGIATTLMVYAFQNNMLYFISPADIQAGKAPSDTAFRVGGMVVDGSFEREEGTTLVAFTLTDYAATVRVQFDGILPDLFREGQGIVAQGKLNDQGVFEASEVLAKHDEGYMPPEVAEALEKGKEASGGT